MNGESCSSSWFLTSYNILRKHREERGVKERMSEEENYEKVTIEGQDMYDGGAQERAVYVLCSGVARQPCVILCRNMMELTG